MPKGDYLAEFEQIVLLALARLGRDGYGVAIHDEIQATTGREVSVPSVYVTLTRLEVKGYVSSRTGEPSARRGGRAKRYFSLEPAGARALSQSREVLDRLWAGVSLRPNEREG